MLASVVMHIWRPLQTLLSVATEHFLRTSSEYPYKLANEDRPLLTLTEHSSELWTDFSTQRQSKEGTWINGMMWHIFGSLPLSSYQVTQRKIRKGRKQGKEEIVSTTNVVTTWKEELDFNCTHIKIWTRSQFLRKTLDEQQANTIAISKFS